MPSEFFEKALERGMSGDSVAENTVNEADAASGDASKQHWVYVWGGGDLDLKAESWVARKTKQGKRYTVIHDPAEKSVPGPLRRVANNDVLYILAAEVSGGRLPGKPGEPSLDPAEMAIRLQAEGLDTGHREVKVFASRSGDGGTDSFASLLYQAMRPAYPDVLVSGYLGHVDVEGFDGHKTAGLQKEESLADIDREAWLKRSARAKENRVQFPAEEQARS